MAQLAMRFVPYHHLGDTPNVIVDGSAAPSTVLTLSHWPGSPTPVDLRRDLSAEIALASLRRPGLLDGIEAVSNNHFDQDGLMSAFALIEPEAALARQRRLVDVARAGDFGTFEDRDSARIAFVLAAHDDPDRSPLPAGLFAERYPDLCANLYEALLPQVAGMLDHPERWRDLWLAEDAHLGESIEALATGSAGLVEWPDVDLAVVTVPEMLAERMTTRFTVSRSDALHPMVVNNATAMLRLLTVQGRRYRLELRYETWVMLTSRRTMPRPDLRAIADRLTDLETRGAVWTGEAPGALTPTLTHDSESSIAPEALLAALRDLLAEAPPVWDPFTPR